MIFSLAIYRYQNESLIDSLHILTNEKGGLRAYLYAENGAQSEALRILKQSLRTQNYKCVPTLYDGKPVLEVRGFDKPEQLISLLSDLHAIKGTPEMVMEEGDKRTNKEKLGNSTLKMAGGFYNIGDISYMYYKGAPLLEQWKHFPKGEKFGGKFFGILDVVAGVGYGLGSLVLTFFGSRDQSLNTIRTATAQIERYARKENYEITPESSIAFVNQDPKRGFFGSIKQALERYPSEIFNSIYVFVGLFLSAAAVYHSTRPIDKALPVAELKKALKAQFWNRVDVGLGVVTATSAITGLVVKEQKPVKGDPKRDGIGGVIDWIREKPLRATGIGYMIATGFHAWSTTGMWVDKTEKPQYLIGRAIFIVANVASEFLLAVSSKGHGVGVKPDASVDNSVIAATSELILRQPPEKHEAMIQRLAGYMAVPEVLGGDAETIAKELRTHLAALKQNPWTKHYVFVPNGSGEKTAVETELANMPAQEAPAKPANIVSGGIEYVAKQQAPELALA